MRSNKLSNNGCKILETPDWLLVKANCNLYGFYFPIRVKYLVVREPYIGYYMDFIRKQYNEEVRLTPEWLADLAT